jgi:hypothetical protein
MFFTINQNKFYTLQIGKSKRGLALGNFTTILFSCPDFGNERSESGRSPFLEGLSFLNM